ncbi:hypothetical protein NST81_01800 [Bacillus sp. FSL W8-0223]|uniref:hypothetical protein n=1 Tax=Bacillus sp. FSL W8-0223 TaxID=2954595 RepID=UPI0030F7E4EA
MGLMTKQEREDIIEFLYFATMDSGKYSRSFFENQTDDELQRMYDNWTKEGRLF